MDNNVFDEQCRLCRFLNGASPCSNRRIETVDGVDVCTGYEAEEV